MDLIALKSSTYIGSDVNIVDLTILVLTAFSTFGSKNMLSMRYASSWTVDRHNYSNAAVLDGE